MKVFTYTKTPVSIERLKQEIRDSLVIIALAAPEVVVFGDNVDVYFKADLSLEDVAILDSVIAAHAGVATASEENKAICITEQQNDFLPTPRAYKVGMRATKTDSTGNQVIRGQILTDEGSFRDNFFGDSLFQTLTGVFEFSSLSDVVLSHDADLSETKTLFPYLKLSTDSDDKLTQGQLITSASFGLNSNYKGSTGVGSAICSNWFPTISENISVAIVDSWLTISSTTGATSSAKIEKFMDYLPLRLSFKANINKRVLGQVVTFGVYEYEGSRVQVQLSGTDETKVMFVTASKDGLVETQTSTVTIPRGLKSSKDHVYTVEVTNGQCSLLINDVLLVTHKDKIPDAYDPMSIFINIENTNVASSNVFKIDWVHFQSLDQVDIANTFSNTPVKTDTVTPKSVDGKPMMTTSPRPIGTYTYFSSQGDDSSDQSTIASGNKLKFKHLVGDAVDVIQYFDVNSIINETHINKATVQWCGALNDIIEGMVVPQVTEVIDLTGGNFTVISGIVVATPAGYGNKNLDLNNAKLVEMVPNEFGVTPSGYWDATYNTTTKAFENITFNPTGYGQFNIFASELKLFRFIPCFCMLDKGTYEIPSEDTSRVGHNMRIKVTYRTDVVDEADHNWSANVALRLYRKKTC